MASILLHLMRHGIPQRSGLLLGHCDDVPQACGIALCIDRAKDLTFDHIYSSDLTRAALPAQRIAAQYHLPHHIDPLWRELDFGAWSGLHAADIAPDAYARFWDDPDANPPPQGESWSALQNRIQTALGTVTTSSLILTHAGAMRAALACLCRMGHQQVWAFDLPYSCVLSLRVWPQASEPTAQIIGLRT